MRILLSIVAIACAVTPAAVAAEVDRKAIAEAAVSSHILPAYETFSGAATNLVGPAQACNAEELRVSYHTAFDAWMGVQHIAMGPVEGDMQRFAIAFWPDTKGFVKKGVDRLIKAKDPVVDDAVAFAKVSVAARGLTALERLLYDVEGEVGFDREDGAYRCRLAQAIARDLATTAQSVIDGWRGETGHAKTLLTAGAPGNAIYLKPQDAVRDLFKSLDGGVQAAMELRLGRPLGTFEKPRPKRAETWRSNRTMRNVRISIVSLQDFYETVFAQSLEPDAREKVSSDFARAIELAERAPDAIDKAVTDPAQRFKVESLHTQLRELQKSLRLVLAPSIGVTIGFNSLDGD
ncbi:MAG: imelysin family protein [Pseudomonadota bacterium]